MKFNPNVKIEALHRNIKVRSLSSSIERIRTVTDRRPSTNVQDTDFNVDYFKQFDFVMNALDNLGSLSLPLPLPPPPLALAHLQTIERVDARRHVNKMCLAANIPLIESGTSGYRGQVQPIKGNTTDCFDCTGTHLSFITSLHR